MYFMLKLEHFVESLVCALISAKYMFRRILYRMQAHSIPEQHTHTLIILSKFCAFQLQPRTKLFYAHLETQKHRKRKKKTTQYILCNFSATILLQNNKHAFVLYHDHFISVH